MAKKSNEDLTRVHIWLKTDDVAKLHQYFDDTLGFSNAVRTMVSQYIRRLEAKAGEKAKSIQINPSDMEFLNHGE